VSIRNVRNFWLTAEVDGRRTDIETVPIASDGGMNLTILVREQGSVSESLVEIRCVSVGGENKIFIEIVRGDESEIHELKVER